jgi:glutamate formiminotransferase
VVAAIVDSARLWEATHNVRVVDWSADPDHNRMVVTLLGEEQGVALAMMAMARTAIAQIDLRTQLGVHPRIGAVDVLPVIPIRHASVDSANQLAITIARQIAGELHVPIRLYERSAPAGKTFSLPEIRKEVKQAMAHPETLPLLPDFGPEQPHPSAGVTVAGARGPLTAYNIDLETPDIAIARTIATEIRAQRTQITWLSGVRALGLYLESQGCAQVSMNLTLPHLSPMPAVFDFVKQLALAAGTRPIRSEIIGVIPAVSLGNRSPEEILWHDYKPEKVIENWLQRP